MSKGLIVCVFFFSILGIAGCASNQIKTDEAKGIEVFKADLNGDGRLQTVVLKNKPDSGSATLTVDQPGAGSANSIDLPPDFERIEFFDLNDNGASEIFVFSRDDNKKVGLVIYDFSKGRMQEMFSFCGDCSIRVDDNRGIPRIKVGKFKRSNDSCSLDNLNWRTWSWVWFEDKFIEE